MPTSFSWPIPCPPLRDGELGLVPWGEVASISNVREDLIESCNDPRMVRWTQVPHPYTAAQWARGRGLTTRAVRLVSDHAFAHGVHRLVIRASVENAASRHVAEACGYTFEGVLRGAELLRGEFIDHAQYSRLVTD